MQSVYNNWFLQILYALVTALPLSIIFNKNKIFKIVTGVCYVLCIIPFEILFSIILKNIGIDKYDYKIYFFIAVFVLSRISLIALVCIQNRMPWYVITCTLIYGVILFCLLYFLKEYDSANLNGISGFSLCIILFLLAIYILGWVLFLRNKKESNKMNSRDYLVHDMKNQVFVLYEAMKNKPNEAIHILENMYCSLSESEQNNLTGIKALDALLASKKRIMDKYNIKYTQSVFMVKKMIPLMDFCILLGNLMDNAIEAAMQCENKKTVELKIKQQKNHISIHIRNSYSGQLIEKNNRFMTTKTDKINHGIGLKSIGRIVKKYNGNINFERNDNLFNVYVFLEIS